MFTHAICRRPGMDAAGGITTAGLGAPDIELLLRQHAAYVETLRSLGLEVTVLDPLPGFPDAYFVEDPAVILPGAAVLTRPGAGSRRGETVAMEDALHRRSEAFGGRIERIRAPGTLDGGDVLQVGKRLFIGISARTNQAGAAQLGKIAAELGFTWTPVPVGQGLHLKSGVSLVGEDTLLIAPSLAGRPEFEGYHKLLIPEEEAYAANSLWINGTLLFPAGFPRTRELLETLGGPVRELDVSEIRKMDGGLTCLSLRY